MAHEGRDRVVHDHSDEVRVLEKGRLGVLERGARVGRPHKVGDDSLGEDRTEERRRCKQEDSERFVSEPGSRVDMVSRRPKED